MEYMRCAGTWCAAAQRELMLDRLPRGQQTWLPCLQNVPGFTLVREAAHGPRAGVAAYPLSVTVSLEHKQTLLLYCLQPLFYHSEKLQSLLWESHACEA